MPGLIPTGSEGGLLGLAPLGFRHEDKVSAPFSAKGNGHFGLLRHGDGGVATEISAHDENGTGFPLLGPWLSPQEFDALLKGAEPTQEMYEKARLFAQSRMASGNSPFAQPLGLKFPTPNANQR